MGNKSLKKIMSDKDPVIWELFFRKLLENLGAYVMVTDNDGRIEFVNSRCEDIMSVSDMNILEMRWPDTIIPEKDRMTVAAIFEDIKRYNTLGCFDAPAKMSDDNSKYLCWIVIPLAEEEKAFYLFIGKEVAKSGNHGAKKHEITHDSFHTAYNKIVDAIFAAAKISDPDTARHAERVMCFSVCLAEKMGLERGNTEKLKAAALLHDLGKLAVDEKILFKKGKLDESEYEEIKKHPEWGAEAVRLMGFLRDIIPIMANHHENFDGTGYPMGLKGEEIPVEARILSVADIFEALTADRPYRRGYSVCEAIAIMEEEKERKLDPAITEIFLEMVKTGEVNTDTCI